MSICVSGHGLVHVPRKNGRHNRPHVRVLYGDDECVLSIPEGEVLAGEMPGRQLRNAPRPISVKRERKSRNSVTLRQRLPISPKPTLLPAMRKLSTVLWLIWIRMDCSRKASALSIFASQKKNCYRCYIVHAVYREQVRAFLRKIFTCSSIKIDIKIYLHE